MEGDTFEAFFQAIEELLLEIKLQCSRDVHIIVHIVQIPVQNAEHLDVETAVLDLLGT